MSKLQLYLLLSIIFFYILPLYNSSEDKRNSKEDITQSLNNIKQSNENDFESNPLKDFDFGNLIWLDDTNATLAIKKYKIIYILFYAPWCEHCKIFLPEYVETSKYAEEKNLTIKFAKIDAELSLNISEEFDIQELPSIFLIYKGEKYIIIQVIDQKMVY